MDKLIINLFLPFDVSIGLRTLGIKTPSSHWFNPNGVLLHKFLETDSDDSEMVTHVYDVIEYYDSCTKGRVDAVRMDEAEIFIAEKYGAHVIPKPILGKKNGYDSFPVMGWGYDLVINNKGAENSYYMGYPISYWFTGILDEDDDEFEDDFNPVPYFESKVIGMRNMVEYLLNNANK